MTPHVWTDPQLPRFASAVNEDCDHPEHGWECRCLVERDPEDPVAAELEQLEEELEMAADAVADAEDELSQREGEYDRILAKIKEIEKRRAGKAA